MTWGDVLVALAGVALGLAAAVLWIAFLLWLSNRDEWFR